MKEKKEKKENQMLSIVPEVMSTSPEITSFESRRRRLGKGNIEESSDLRLLASESEGTIRRSIEVKVKVKVKVKLKVKIKLN